MSERAVGRAHLHSALHGYKDNRYVSMCKPNSIHIDKDVILDACGEMETLFCGAMVHFNGPGSSVAFGVKCS